jgi:peptide chain release factor subunit 1
LFKDKFKEGEYLDYQLRDKILGVVDTSYTGMQGLQEILQRGESLIEEASVVKERRLMEEFFEHLKKDDGLSVYGLDEVKRALDFGAVKTLLISEEFNWIRAKFSCQCGFETEKDVKRDTIKKCPKCKSEMEITEEKDLTGVLSEQAESIGSKVEIISTESREGAQFDQLGGIAAILRYKIE